MERKLVALCLGCTLLSGCMSDSGNDVVTTPKVPFENISQGSQTGISNQQLHAIRTGAELAALASAAKLSAPVPSVDFAANNVVAVFTGMGDGCGLPVSVTGAGETANTLVVNVEKQVPGPGLACLPVVPAAGPYVLATIPNTSKPVSFAFTLKPVP